MKILRDPMLLLLLSLLLAWGVYEGGQPPEVKAANTPDSVFSAVRAEAVLQRLYIDNKPHVAGSAANAEMRDRIISTLESFGYAPEIQSRFHCRPDIGWCSPVENIIAVHQGRGGDSAILLTAHYDSGWAGPGVSDDGAGVAAILEMARMAAQQGEFEYSLMFLLTDGEEMGLIGADAFARHNPLFERVKAVINLEARGSTGASVMFETGPGNRGMIRMLAKNLERPVANSLTEEVYRRMPNDTDFSVYRNYDLPGVNFAFTQGASIYHSQIDDLLHLDRGSLQHHGQNAWSMVQAMDERDLERITSSEQAAYIDLFGRKLLHYPLSSAAGLALVLSVLVLAAINRSFARQIRFRELLWTFLGSVLLLIAVP
ncbi:MAG TPA: M28 family peptidase, partial [Xanthomonadales bacterium]|nr:M28 family peptidase [Xanthomonadales bacterium]